ncbi:Sulfite exporter TauE/SafE [Seminavis robusta]|uniref:Sulfite exporter TauE/SafE n=1 Tax=Seminavis robusta TaxID=568900 RepID=A0A9N8EQF6_9STRA|nr:Sulfite exporter TauE/SafE [Seminavis robusta]|eukprot:Sro1394_g268930.1 Sulfite exporter TauE/SafE (319) ;mRNA; f:11365-12321
MQNFTRQQLPRHLYAFGTGVAAGGVVGTVGWGGAQVLIPSLTANPLSLAGYTQLTATGISLTSLSTSVMTGGYKFWNSDHVNVPVALMVGIPAVLSARVGTLWAKKLSGDALALIFNSCSIVLLPTHFWIQERAKKRRQQQLIQEEDNKPPQESTTTITTKTNDPPNVVYDNTNDLLLKQSQQQQQSDYHYEKFLHFASFGLFQGILSSVMGVGGLPLSMSYLTEMTTLDHHTVQGTAMCAVIPSILTSAVSRMHAIPLVTAGVVCGGAILGGYGGAQLALALDSEQLRQLYMTSLVLFGGRSMLGAAANLRRLLFFK